jgi:hypothetical protein
MDKNSGNGVTAFCECAGALCNQARSLGDQLINGNHVTRRRGSATDLAGTTTSTPRATLCFAKEAACAFRYVTSRDVSR